VLKALFFGLSLVLFGGIADRALSLGALGETQASYTVKIAGIPVGLLGIAANTSNRQYAVAGDIRSTGIVAAFAKLRFKATSRGWFRGENGFKPRDYIEESLSKGKQSSRSMRYENGRPILSEVSPAPALSGKKQVGTVDPMTAIFATFRDRSRDQLCKGDLEIYDGKTRAILKLTPGNITKDAARCIGGYQRLAGFSEDKMAEGTSFPLQIDYQRVGKIYQVRNLTIQSTRGRAQFSRR
tara:strand:+ start:380 stop:1099 length:720 start_codon:yes stop_codon:yes gene_type:complete